VVQQAMCIILEAIYEPTFNMHSHGFRPNKSCHTALKEMRSYWTGMKWCIEGDIKGCYDNISHKILVDILRRKIQDERFLNLLWRLMRAGAMVDDTFVRTDLGVPQGSIVSPILANIYLNEFDQFLEKIALVVNTPQKRRKRDYVANKVEYALRKARKQNNSTTSSLEIKRQRELYKLARSIPGYDPFDPNFLRFKFIRYADDWVVGVIGPVSLVRTIYSLVEEFLRVELKLELSKDKSHITYMPSGKVEFLGYRVQSGKSSTYSVNPDVKRKSVGWQIRLFAPTEKLVEKLYENNFCTKQGRGVCTQGWIVYPDDIIISRYNSIIRGLRNYYAPADNFTTTFDRLQYIIKFSCAHTLAAKHKSRVSIQIAKLNLMLENNEKGRLDIPRPKKDINNFKIKVVDMNKVFNSYAARTSTLSATKCIICDSSEGLEMHHLKHLRKDNVALEDNYFRAVMQRMNRKQVTVCRKCHMDIHRGIYDGQSLRLLSERKGDLT
jgi:group II intron reverse transcriptase/maturase